MIKKLKVRNFKSLKEFEIDFEKFNVLIGRNNSGKSNVIDCIKFLSNLIDERDLRSILRKREESYKDIVYGRDYKNDIFIEAVVELDGEEFTYKISFSGVNEDIRHEDEELRIIGDRGEEVIRWEGKGEDHYALVFIRGDARKEIVSTNVKSLIFLNFLRGPVIDANVIESLYRFSDFMKSIKLYEFYPKEMKEPERRIRVPLQSYILDENGANILEVLHTLYLECKQSFDRTSELLCDAIDAEELKVIPRERGMYIALKEKGFKEPFPLWSMSDGSLKMIGCITALHTTDFFEPSYGDYKAKINNPLFCFEEPENYIYPRLSEFLVDLMKNSDAQVILTTHSPHIANLVDEDDLIIIRKDKEGTKAVKQLDKIRMLKESYSQNTGELWMSGILKDLFGEE